MKNREVTLFLTLPEELITQITSELDIKSMINFKLVCKQWRNFVSNNPLVAKGNVHFIAYRSDSLRFGALGDETNQNPPRNPLHEVTWMNILHSPPGTGSGEPDPPERIELVTSSCNGLICFLGREKTDRDVYICNPIAGEYISLRKPGFPPRVPLYDLGFCPSSNEYKLTTFTMRTLDVYTLGSTSGWRRVPLEHPNPALEPAICLRAICVGGVFHWLKTSGNVLTFDLAEEVFGSIPLPRLDDDKEIYRLGCMDHCLVVTAGYIDDPYLGLEIWATKEDKSSIWTKKWVIHASQFVDDKSIYAEIDFKQLLVLQKLSSDGRIFMMLYDKYLYSYDPRDKLVRYYYMNEDVSPRRLFAYTATLVSPTKLMQSEPCEKTQQEGSKIGGKKRKLGS